jgi:hypothetical protein
MIVAVLTWIESKRQETDVTLPQRDLHHRAFARFAVADLQVVAKAEISRRLAPEIPGPMS